MATKKSFIPLHTALTEYAQDATVAELMADPSFTKLMEAKKGGFSGEDMYVEIEGEKVARMCAMTGAVFAHDNSDKSISFFYKNGSYMIGAEIVKANARKAFDLIQEAEEATLEEQMLEGEIAPKEWKEAVTALNANKFDFVLDEDTKQNLIESFEGYATKEDFIEAYNADLVAPFADFTEQTEALRALAPSKD